jgi:hypothetical protein
MKTLIYEMNVSTWVNADEMIKHLDRVKELGAKYVCLSGLCSETDYEKVAEPFDDDSFANFMKKARELKLEVLMNLNLDSTATTNVWRADEDLYSYTEGNRAYLKWWDEGDKNEENKNPVIAKMFHDLVIFWGDRGICGFKVHVPHPNGQLDNIAGKAEVILISVFSTVNVRVIIEVDKFQDSERFSYLADWILDSSLSKNTENFMSEAKKLSESYLFMLSTETSASKKRFPEVQDCTPESARWMLFHTGAKTLWLYQGQELGLTDDPKNAFPIQDYEFQERHANSYLNAFLKECAEWQNS